MHNERARNACYTALFDGSEQIGVNGRQGRKLPHNLKVRGSNPLPATNFIERAASAREAAFLLLHASCNSAASAVKAP